MGATARLRVGQIVPSSNITMETEIPALLRRHAEHTGDVEFTFHSSRMRMKTVSKDELAAMDADSDRCALELSDAGVDVMGYACLVAIMATGHGYHRQSSERLHGTTVANGAPAPVVTSAGALINALHHLGARRIGVVAPYMLPLTELVVDYIRSEGIEVQDFIALEIPDNLEVAAQDPMNLVEHINKVDTNGADAVVLSACVQMPSLEAIQVVEDRLGIPVLSAAVATAWQMLTELGRAPEIPGAGCLLRPKNHRSNGIGSMVRNAMSDDAFVRSSRESPGPRDWILDLYGSFIRDYGGWIGVADLLVLLESLGVSQTSARSALSRMKRQGELLGAAQGTVRGYSLTESADEWFRDGTGRIMDGPPAMSDEHWVIAAFTVPEAVRSMRYRIRSRLQALGFGQLSGGLMIAPAWILDEAMRALDRAGLGGHVDMWQSRHIGFSSMKTIVANAWNLDQIDTAYRDYLDLAADLERRQAPSDDEEAFVRYVANINAWRELPFLDPGIPLQYLPEGWLSAEARSAFTQLSANLRPRAWRHFVRVTSTTRRAE